MHGAPVAVQVACGQGHKAEGSRYIHSDQKRRPKNVGLILKR